MLQITLHEPGRFATVDGPEPVPAPGEALVRVHRVGVCGTDLHAFAGRQPFFTYPRILGHELGVEIIDAGDNPRGLQRGDRCSVEPYLHCGRCIACRQGKPNCCTELKVLGVHVDGGMRPLLAVRSDKLHRSTRLDFDQLALVETLAIGAHAVERAQLVANEFVLVIGAGPIGLSALQFAQLSGVKLAVMEVSATRLDFCRERLGVEHTVLGGDDVLSRLQAIGGGDLPSCVIDATGNAASMAGTFDLAAHGGRIVFVGLVQGAITFHDPNFHRRELTLLASRNALPGTFSHILSLIEDGRIDTRPWITHRLALTEVPRLFPEKISGNPAVLKAMIEV